MMIKCLVVLAALVAVSSAGILAPAAVPAALTVGTYASTYNAHTINHAIASPYVAAAAPYVAAAAPAAVAAPLTYPYPALSAYSAYSAYPYSAPYIALR